MEYELWTMDYGPRITGYGLWALDTFWIPFSCQKPSENAAETPNMQGIQESLAALMDRGG